jgi:hypothetical protein
VGNPGDEFSGVTKTIKNLKKGSLHSICEAVEMCKRLEIPITLTEMLEMPTMQLIQRCPVLLTRLEKNAGVRTIGSGN